MNKINYVTHQLLS